MQGPYIQQDKDKIEKYMYAPIPRRRGGLQRHMRVPHPQRLLTRGLVPSDADADAPLISNSLVRRGIRITRSSYGGGGSSRHQNPIHLPLDVELLKGQRADEPWERREQEADWEEWDA